MAAKTFGHPLVEGEHQCGHHLCAVWQVLDPFLFEMFYKELFFSQSNNNCFSQVSKFKDLWWRVSSTQTCWALPPTSWMRPSGKNISSHHQIVIFLYFQASTLQSFLRMWSARSILLSIPVFPVFICSLKNLRNTPHPVICLRGYGGSPRHFFLAKRSFSNW
jgi:hypothetical protein